MGDLTYDSPEHPRNSTAKYRCDGCGAEHVKLWRGVHGCKDEQGRELTCASCTTSAVVDARGRAYCADLELSSDQIDGKLPAVPVGDTYWGYSSIPSEAVRWWSALSTYPGDIDPRDATIATLRAAVRAADAYFAAEYQSDMTALDAREKYAEARAKCGDVT